MRIKKSVRYMCLGLIFVMLCGSVFLGSRSFAKYLEEYKNQQEAGVASPVSVYTRASLTRKQGGGDPIVYTLDDTMPFTISDIAPLDELTYMFSIKNFDTELKNEVLLKVTLSFSVYLLVLTEPDNEGDDPIRTYSSFKVGESYTSPTREETIDGEKVDVSEHRYKGSVALFKDDSKDTNFELSDFGVVDVVSSDEVDYTNSKLISKLVTKQVENHSFQVYEHSIGFYMDPYSVDVIEKGYYLSVILPEHNFGNTVDSNYIGAKLSIDLEVNTEQVLAK